MRPTPRFWCPNLRFGRPNLGFDRPNLRFGCPNMIFLRPNLRFGSPNLRFGHPNLRFGRPNLRCGWPNLFYIKYKNHPPVHKTGTFLSTEPFRSGLVRRQIRSVYIRSVPHLFKIRFLYFRSVPLFRCINRSGPLLYIPDIFLSRWN